MSTLSQNERITEILSSIGELIRRIELWMKDQDGHPYVPKAVDIAIEFARRACTVGDIPECCRDVCSSKFPEFYAEYDRYVNRESGHYSPTSGAPMSRFWALAKALKVSHKATQTPMDEEENTPVDILLKSGVSYEQIAFHIYGIRGNGPFVMKSGAPNIAKIDQEAKNPGSVIKPGWRAELKSLMGMVDKSEVDDSMKLYDFLVDGKPAENPLSAEELLEEGAYVHQVMKAKGLTENEVIQIARRAGITPDWGPMPRMAKAESSDDDATAHAADSKMDQESVKAEILAVYRESNGSLGTAEIAEAVFERTGMRPSTKSISAVIRWDKQKSPELAGASAE